MSRLDPTGLSDELDALLDARTRALAEPPRAVDTRGSLEVLLVRLAGERYGLPARSVTSVAALTHLTAMPHAPPELAGLTSFGGIVVPVFHLRAVLGLALTALPEHGRAVRLDSPDGPLALVVDQIEGVEHVDPAALRPAPTTLAAASRALVLGIDPSSGLVVLDDAALVADPRLYIDVAAPAAVERRRGE